ncbi:MAG TPA: hypothetical protein VIG72_06060, partial [Pontibacter sp.]
MLKLVKIKIMTVKSFLYAVLLTTSSTVLAQNTSKQTSEVAKQGIKDLIDSSGKMGVVSSFDTR